MNINISQPNSTGGWEGGTIYLTATTLPPELVGMVTTGDNNGGTGSSNNGGMGDSYACPVCNVQFQTRSQLMGHTRKHMKDKLFQCKLCEANFPSHKELKGHLGPEGEEGEGSSSYICGICGKGFPSGDCLTFHLTSHKVISQGGGHHGGHELLTTTSNSIILDNQHGERSEYQIQIQVQDPLTLDLDLEGQTLTVDPSQIEISHIGNVVVIPAPSSTSPGDGSLGNIITTASLHELSSVQDHDIVTIESQDPSGGMEVNVHVPTSSPPPPSQPPAPKKKRTRNPGGHAALNSNIQVQVLSGGPNCHRYSCTLCQKTFKNSQHVQRHLRIHTGEKPFSCSVCSQSFSLNHNLQRHMRTHTGEKPHKCGVCRKEFAEGHNLKRHMISAHDGPTPYVCPTCGRKFAENSILKKHQSKAHKNNS